MQTVIIETENSNQLDLLLRLAKELHLKTEVAESEKAEKIILSKMAETAFAKDWNSKEDEVWTEFLNK